jgi:hypothetical protein
VKMPRHARRNETGAAADANQVLDSRLGACGFRWSLSQPPRATRKQESSFSEEKEAKTLLFLCGFQLSG